MSGNNVGAVSLAYDDGGTKKKSPQSNKTDPTKDLPDHAPEWAKSASRRLKWKRSSSSLDSQTPSSRVPEGVHSVLLHSCCAPCSGAMIEEMIHSETDEKQPLKVVVFFYNPNIHPRKEYEIRKQENKRFCHELNIEFVDCDYDVDEWYKRMRGMEYDPERGKRCTACFDMRMERTALYAHEHGFNAIATTNATSRWKDASQVDASGYKAARRYPNLVYWCENWQSDEMTIRKYQVSAAEHFYKQEYCGCSYSLRDSNMWRDANHIPKIQIGGETAGLGNRYFTDPIADAEEENQDVVDEFFKHANEVAGEGATGDRSNDYYTERKKKLEIYKDRRKHEKDDGIVNGLNNW